MGDQGPNHVYLSSLNEFEHNFIEEKRLYETYCNPTELMILTEGYSSRSQEPKKQYQACFRPDTGSSRSSRDPSKSSDAKSKNSFHSS